MEEIPQWMKDHMEADQAFQDRLEKEVIPTLAKTEDLKGLATEKSIRDVVHWQKNIVAAGEMISGGSKWGYRAYAVRMFLKSCD